MAAVIGRPQHKPAAFLAQMGKGRAKGSKNKVSTEAKQVIAQAAAELGGVDRLVAWAKEDPENEAKFWTTIYPRLIPVEVTGQDGAPIQFEQVQNDAAAFASALACLSARVGTGSETSGTQH